MDVKRGTTKPKTCGEYVQLHTVPALLGVEKCFSSAVLIRIQGVLDKASQSLELLEMTMTNINAVGSRGVRN